jgi:hypothetical protein
VNYCGFVDPSGGASDSMTPGIAHKEGDVAVLDFLRERKPPFSPSEVAAEFAAELKRFGIAAVRGDRYGAEWVAEQFRSQGIAYSPAERNKSDIYGELIPLVNSGNAELLDNQRLIAQLGNLERRTARGGRSSIDHPPAGHDDLANAAAGALTMRGVVPTGELMLLTQRAQRILPVQIRRKILHLFNFSQFFYPSVSSLNLLHPKPYESKATALHQTGDPP